MRSFTLFATAALASVALAQSPLTTLVGGGNSGNAGGGIYFNLTVNTTVTFTQIDYYASVASLTGSSWADIYLGPSTYVGNVTNASLWTLVASTVPVSIPTVPAAPMLINGVLVSPFALGPGTYGIALKSNVHSWSYTNGGTCTSTTIPGSCTSPSSTFSNAELTLRAGAAQNAFLTGGIFQPRVWNGAIYYTPGGTPVNVASWQPIGDGCYKRSRSFYEFWPSSVTVDFGTVTAGGSGISSMLMTLNPNSSYSMTGGTNTIITPSTPSLALGDDVTQVITLDPLGTPILYAGTSGITLATSVEMGSNGYLTFNGTSNPALVPDPAPFLANSAIVGNWHDFDPSQAGASTNYEWNPTLGGIGAHIFSWIACPDFGIAGSSNNYQIIIYANSNIEMRWGAMSQSGGGGWPTVLGYSPGGGAYNPGSRDLSASLPFSSDNLDSAPLALAMTARPQLGTSPGFAISGGEALPVQVAAFLVVSLAGFPGGVPMSGPPFLMPECNQYANIAGSPTFFLFGNPPPVFNFPIPNLAQYNGQVVFAQAFGISGSFNTTGFGIGANASNGVRMVAGSL